MSSLPAACMVGLTSWLRSQCTEQQVTSESWLKQISAYLIGLRHEVCTFMCKNTALLVANLLCLLIMTWHWNHGQSEMAASHTHQQYSSTHSYDTLNKRYNPVWRHTGQAGGQVTTAVTLRLVQDRRAFLIVSACSTRLRRLRPHATLHSDSLHNPWLAEADWIGFWKRNNCIDPSEWMESCWHAVVKW